MIMYSNIRWMFFPEHLTISEISESTTLTRNAIKKWSKFTDGTETNYY